MFLPKQNPGALTAHCTSNTECSVFSFEALQKVCMIFNNILNYKKVTLKVKARKINSAQAEKNWEIWALFDEQEGDGKPSDTEAVDKIQVNIDHLYTNPTAPKLFFFFWSSISGHVRIKKPEYGCPYSSTHEFPICSMVPVEAAFLEFENKRNKGITAPGRSRFGPQSSHMVRICLSEGLEIESILMSTSLMWDKND